MASSDNTTNVEAYFLSASIPTEAAQRVQALLLAHGAEMVGLAGRMMLVRGVEHTELIRQGRQHCLAPIDALAKFENVCGL
jgi:hypothetical protein